MKGDNSRDTFLREKHYRTLRMQQGRVQVDADWNEQADIQESLLTGVASDLIVGSAGVGIPAVPITSPPAPNQGAFGITAATGGTNLQIQAGRYYVEGVLAELNPPPAGNTYLFTAQPDLPLGSPANPAFLPSNNGTYLVYLDVWQRHITAIEDPSIREVALGGPDTATRTQTVAQVKLLSATGGTCASSIPAFDQLVKPTNPVQGQLAAQANAPVNASTPCDVGTGGGFTGLENQLYRVEIHQGGNVPGTVTYKWSRDNGSILSAISATALPPTLLNPVIVLAAAPTDDAHGFAVGQWVEVLDDKIELQGRSGVMAKLTNVDGVNLTFDVNNVFNPDGSRVTIASPPSSPPNLLTIGGIDLTAHPKVRRWDQNTGAATGSILVPTTNTFVDLENGVQVKFLSPGFYRTGDYWLIPARTAIGSTSGVDWPTDPIGSPPVAVPRLVSPRGIVHRYARLAMVDFTNGQYTVLSDCRRRLPALSTLNTDDVAFTSIPVTLPIPPLPQPQTLTAALLALGQRTAPPPKVRASVLATNSVIITNNTVATSFVPMNNMSLPNLTFNNPDPSTGRTSVIVRLFVAGLSPQRVTGITEGDAEFQLVMTPAATGVGIVIATCFEAYFANASGFFEVHHLFMERLLAGPPQSPPNSQAVGGLTPGTYSFSVNWSIKNTSTVGAQLAMCTAGTTRELTVTEL